MTIRLSSSTRLTAAATLALCALCALCAVSTAQAHRLWLMPNVVHSGGTDHIVVVDAVASEDLFVHELPLELGRVTILDPQGKVVAPTTTINGKNRNSLEIKLDTAGTYRVSNVRDMAFARYKQGGETKGWRGKPQELAAAVPADASDVNATLIKIRTDTFFSRDNDTLPPFAAEGQGIELQVLTPVTDLSDGDSSRFRILVDGKPAAGVEVSLLRGENRYRYKMGEATLKSDTRGEFSLTWPEAGRWLMGITNGDVDARGSVDKPVQRQMYSATFEVLPR